MQTESKKLYFQCFEIKYWEERFTFYNFIEVCKVKTSDKLPHPCALENKVNLGEQGEP